MILYFLVRQDCIQQLSSYMDEHNNCITINYFVSEKILHYKKYVASLVVSKQEVIIVTLCPIHISHFW